MGGYGSGRWERWEKKARTDQMRQIDVNQLHRAGVLRPGVYGTWGWWDESGKQVASIGFQAQADALRLTYTVTIRGKKPEQIDSHIPITWTPCNYGGKRPWFQCLGCGRRVAKLYGGRLFLCRHCHGLTYWTCNNSHDRLTMAQYRIMQIRRKLGDENATMGDWENPIPPSKPKGMHWRTYNRLVERLHWEQQEARVAWLVTCRQMLEQLGIDWRKEGVEEA